jgi:hypothetical protein
MKSAVRQPRTAFDMAKTKKETDRTEKTEIMSQYNKPDDAVVAKRAGLPVTSAKGSDKIYRPERNNLIDSLASTTLAVLIAGAEHGFDEPWPFGPESNPQ